MKLLLDTHAFLWFVAGDAMFSSRGRSLIEDETKEKLVSIVSLWEIAIKTSIGKLSLAKPFAEFIPEQLQRNGFEILGLTIAHTAQAASLPLHHRDPFDRMLAAQCLSEGLPLLSSDERLDAYGIERFW